MSYVKQKIANFIPLKDLRQLDKSAASIEDYLKNKTKRCNATNKVNKQRCRAKAINGTNKCKMHGGLSTGPKTEAGKKKALANLKQNRKK